MIYFVDIKSSCYANRPIMPVSGCEIDIRRLRIKIFLANQALDFVAIDRD